MSITRFAIVAALLFVTGCAARHHGQGTRLQGPENATMPVYRNQRVPDKLYVLAELPDGKKHAFLVDTGSSLTTVSNEVAESLGLVVKQRSGRLIGLGGSSIWRAATLESMELGDFTLRNIDVAVGVTGLATRVGLVPLAGIIGNNIWSQFQMSIDYPGNTLTLARGNMAIPVSATPMFFNGQHPLTRARITPKSGEHSHPLLLEIDTGARGLLLLGDPPKALASQASIGEEPIIGIGSPDDLPPSQLLRKTRRIPLRSVGAGGLTIKRNLNATWLQGRPRRPGEQARFSGLLGHEILSGNVAYLDYLGRQFALIPSTTKATPRPIHDWYLQQLKRSKDPNRHLNAVRILLWLGRSDEAHKALGKLVRKKKPDPAAVVLYARLQRREGNAKHAQSMLDKLNIDALIETGEFNAWVNTLWLTGNHGAALSATKSAIASSPKDSHVWVARSDALRASGRLAASRAALHRANKLEENPDGHLLRRAWLAVEENDQYAAMTHLRRLLELFPAGGVVHLLYAQQADNPRTMELVRQDLRRAQKRLHSGDGPLDFMAAAWRIVGDPKQATSLKEAGLKRDCSRASTEHSKDNCKAWYSALVHQELDDARTRIDRAVRAEPTKAEFLDTLAMVLEAQGHIGAAKDAAIKAATLAPDDIYLLVQAARLSHAEALP